MVVAWKEVVLLAYLLPLVFVLAVAKPPYLLQLMKREDVLIGVVADHEFEEFLLKAGVEVGEGVGLAEEAEESKHMFGRVGESQVVEVLEIDFAFFEDIHLQVDQVAEVHLPIHRI